MYILFHHLLIEGSPSNSIPVGDKSPPEDVSSYFHGLSKRDFKNAIGALYKEGRYVRVDMDGLMVRCGRSDEWRMHQSYIYHIIISIIHIIIISAIIVLFFFIIVIVIIIALFIIIIIIIIIIIAVVVIIKIINNIGMVRPGSFETVLVPYEQQVAQKDALEASRKTSKSSINSDDSSSPSTVGTASTTSTAKPVYERRDDRTIFVGNLPISINQKIMTNAVEKVVDRTSIRSIRLSLDGDGENT